MGVVDTFGHSCHQECESGETADAKDKNAFFKEFLEELMSSRYATTPVKFAAVPCHLLLSSQLAECVQEKKKK